jgi:hypothetical protein
MLARCVYRPEWGKKNGYQSLSVSEIRETQRAIILKELFLDMPTNLVSSSFIMMVQRSILNIFETFSIAFPDNL